VEEHLSRRERATTLDARGRSDEVTRHVFRSLGGREHGR
jgi:hypothetical protein